MPRRLAATMALIAFAVCLTAGLRADNPFSTTILRSLVALIVTMAIGLVVGAMTQKMLDEGLNPAKKSENEAKSGKGDR